MQQISSRIKQKYDVLPNWSQSNIVLLDGELAVVNCGNQTKFKVGNGLSTFNQLPFIDQEVLSTKWVTVNAVSQGTHAKAVPFGLAAGAYLCANANYSQALGYDAQTISTDVYSFVWNGDTNKNIDHYYNPNAAEDYYNSHGVGSFSINPLSGLSGFYIGEQSLAGILEQSGSKVFIDDHISSVSGKNDLSIIKLSADEYESLLTSNALLSNVLYIVEYPYKSVYGQQIKNLAEATDLSDAVTLAQLHAATSDLSNKANISSVPLSTSQLINDSSFISSHQSLSDYYQKSDTSSSVEISNELNKYQLSGNYLSSNALDSYKPYDETLSSLSTDGYVTQSSLQSTLGSIAISAFSEISSPGASLRNIQQTLTQVLSILQGLRQT